MITLPRRRTFAGLAVLGFALISTACQAAASPAQPAAPATASTSKLFLMVDVVQGSTNLAGDQAAAKGCVLNSRFPRNSQIVWRARVFDPKTGDVMDDKALSKVQIQLANGKTTDMKFGPHPKDPPGEAYWTGSWMVPKDQATGTLNYKVVATAADGRSGEFEPFKVASSLLTITDEVLADAPAKK